MAILKDAFDIGSKLLNAAAALDRRQKLEVAQHFQNLANLYMAFPPAHRVNDRVQVAFLLAKTRTVLLSIKGSSLFETVLGKAEATKFFETADRVVNEKDALSRAHYSEDKYTAIATAAGSLEGYAESLRAQAGDA